MNNSFGEQRTRLNRVTSCENYSRETLRKKTLTTPAILPEEVHARKLDKTQKSRDGDSGNNEKPKTIELAPLQEKH